MRVEAMRHAASTHRSEPVGPYTLIHSFLYPVDFSPASTDIESAIPACSVSTILIGSAAIVELIVYSRRKLTRHL